LSSSLEKNSFSEPGNWSLSGGGGAERFFADIFKSYHKLTKLKFRIIFVTDPISLGRLNRNSHLIV